MRHEYQSASQQNHSGCDNPISNKKQNHITTTGNNKTTKMHTEGKLGCDDDAACVDYKHADKGEHNDLSPHHQFLSYKVKHYDAVEASPPSLNRPKSPREFMFHDPSLGINYEEIGKYMSTNNGDMDDSAWCDDNDDGSDDGVNKEEEDEERREKKNTAMCVLPPSNNTTAAKTIKRQTSSPPRTSRRTNPQQQSCATREHSEKLTRTQRNLMYKSVSTMMKKAKVMREKFGVKIIVSIAMPTGKCSMYSSDHGDINDRHALSVHQCMTGAINRYKEVIQFDNSNDTDNNNMYDKEDIR